jgi:hypothetical protein
MAQEEIPFALVRTNDSAQRPAHAGETGMPRGVVNPVAGPLYHLARSGKTSTSTPAE